MLIEPTCNYAVHYFMKYPELKELLVPELRTSDLGSLYRQRSEEEKKRKTQVSNSLRSLAYRALDLP